jgi:hypothetical protein
LKRSCSNSQSSLSPRTLWKLYMLSCVGWGILGARSWRSWSVWSRRVGFDPRRLWCPWWWRRGPWGSMTRSHCFPHVLKCYMFSRWSCWSTQEHASLIASFSEIRTKKIINLFRS